MKNPLFLFIFLVLGLFAQAQKTHKFSDNFYQVNVDSLTKECSAASFVYLKTNRNGYIDSFRFLNQQNSLFETALIQKFNELKDKKVKFNRKPWVVFYIFLNDEFTYCDSLYYQKMVGTFLKNNYKQENCVFVGPILITPPVR